LAATAIVATFANTLPVKIKNTARKIKIRLIMSNPF
jgi:hypothetical protein